MGQFYCPTEIYRAGSMMLNGKKIHKIVILFEKRWPAVLAWSRDWGRLAEWSEVLPQEFLFFDIQ